MPENLGRFFFKLSTQWWIKGGLTLIIVHILCWPRSQLKEFFNSNLFHGKKKTPRIFSSFHFPLQLSYTWIVIEIHSCPLNVHDKGTILNKNVTSQVEGNTKIRGPFIFKLTSRELYSTDINTPSYDKAIISLKPWCSSHKTCPNLIHVIGLWNYEWQCRR